MDKQMAKRNSRVDNRVHQFGFDFIITGGASLAEIEARIINLLNEAGKEGFDVVGNPGLTDASWTMQEYGINTEADND